MKKGLIIACWMLTDYMKANKTDLAPEQAAFLQSLVKELERHG